MQNARDLLFEIGQDRFISVLDLTKGYWQIPMKDEAKPLTAFVTHSRHYQWKVMSFGMKNAGSTFQKSMDFSLLLHRKYCRSYIDDVAIYSTNWDEHLDHIAKVFKSLQEVGLKVNLKKCAFGRKSVKFLGHIVGSGKHSPDPEKVAWMHVETKTALKEQRRISTRNYSISVSNNEHSVFVLHINHVQEKDRGSYMCQVGTLPMLYQIGYLDVLGK
ncbi:retrovirus-related Pol polyprotein from transposon 17.6 [Trichonephila inaurata madagascariensis]|uniref:Retrovirus-related Pol polyprotein from transposon 17.6 n=1 Tax=Trichonephila inaurata madagascariensis TaxID=2747483 RepID=A0A8X6XCH8_9ARAC|nr:retrovirus-related Pol polyprotein from transposon 17.6 [Trichonephila inaurata madagascariensis]